MSRHFLVRALILSSAISFSAWADDDLFDTVSAAGPAKSVPTPGKPVAPAAPAATAVTKQPASVTAPAASTAATAAAGTKSCLYPLDAEKNLKKDSKADPVDAQVVCARNADELKSCGPVHDAVKGYNPYGHWIAPNPMATVEIKPTPEGDMKMYLPELAQKFAHMPPEIKMVFLVCKNPATNDPAFLRVQGKNFPLNKPFTLSNSIGSATYHMDSAK